MGGRPQRPGGELRARSSGLRSAPFSRPRVARVVLCCLVAACVVVFAGAAADGSDGISASWVVSGPLFSGTIPPEVDAIAVSGSTAYIGGDFLYVGPETGSFVALDGGSGTQQTPWPAVSGSVTGSISDGSGGWYIAGTFTRVGAVQ